MDVRALYLPSVYTNCYLLVDGGDAAVIDPGEDVTATLLRLAADNGWTYRAVYLTHGHYDHVGGVTALRQALPGLPVYLHAADASQDTQLIPTAHLGPLTFWSDGDTLSLGALTVEVLHTPGHTPGSVTLRCGDCLFTGDTLFRGSMGRTDFPGGDEAAIRASLRRLGELPGDYQVLPGHDRPSTLEAERTGNPYLREAMEP